jgi:GntR family transcriptional repressor for pyruvate dehydrogenase complex
MKFSKEPNLRREPKLSEQVAAFLANEITSGHIQPGTSLPSEAELSYRFNVSRTVIREALARLKNDGFIASMQGRRSKVASGPNRNFRLEPSQPLDIQHLYELKALMEGDAAAMAAVRHCQDDIKKLRECLQTLTQALREGIDGTSANFDFHQIVIGASANKYLIDFMRFLNERLWDLIQADEGQTSNLALTQDSLNEHEAIFAAIVKKEPDAARQAAYLHLRNAARRRGLLSIPLLCSILREKVDN